MHRMGMNELLSLKQRRYIDIYVLEQLFVLEYNITVKQSRYKLYSDIPFRMQYIALSKQHRSHSM